MGRPPDCTIFDGGHVFTCGKDVVPKPLAYVFPHDRTQKNKSVLLQDGA